MPGPVVRILDSRWLLPAVLVVLAGYYAVTVPTYWFPWDEGSMAYTAERVLAGEVAHRDFIDTYTGGLNYFHALVFGLFGEDFLTLRITLAISYLAGLAVYFWICRQLLPAHVSALLTLAAGLLGPSLYAGPMPSWYVLLIALCAVACVMKYERQRSPRFLVYAGFLAGGAVLAKITGLYIVAALLLYLVYSEQQQARGHDGAPGGFRVAKVLVLAAFVAMVFALLRPRMQATEFVLWFCPIAVLVVYIGCDDWRSGGSNTARFKGALRLVAPFMLGCAVPLSVYVAYYVLIGEFDSLWQGVLVTPRRRLELGTTSGSLRPLWVVVPGVVATLFLLAGVRLRAWRRSVAAVALAGAVAWLVFGAAHLAYVAFWYWLRLMPLAAVVMVLGSRLSAPIGEEPTTDRTVLLVAAAAAVLALTQYPFPHGIYPLYCAPLLMLSYFAALHRCHRGGEGFIAGGIGFVILFTQMWLAGGDLGPLGIVHKPKPPTAPLAIERASIAVDAGTAKLYRKVVDLVRKQADAKRLYAGPDSPELYFLTRTVNEAGTLYEIFERDYADRDAFERRKLDDIRGAAYDAVVINVRPAFSRPFSPAFMSALKKDYNFWVKVGPFLVAWNR